MERILLVVVSAALFNAGHAQPGALRYFDNWQISETIRIHWDGSGNPSVDPTASPSINGWVVCMSDPSSGQLEFIASNYLYDSLGQPMPLGGGLFGPFVAALPHPGDPSQYFLFPMKYDSLFVAVVDMDLNNGLGDLTAPPTLLMAGMSAQTAAFSSPDGTSHTLITRKIGTPDVHLWSVDALAGMNMTPTTVSIGSTTNWIPGSIRAFKVAPSNDRIAFIEDDSFTLWVQELDAATRQFGQAVRIGFSDPLWDLEFSAENHLLYVSDLSSLGGQLFQLDVSVLDSTLITTTRDTVDTWPDIDPPGVELNMQLGPDLRIYGTFGSQLDTAMLVIRSPDVPGSGCEVTPFDLHLNGGYIWNSLLPWQFWPRANVTGIPAVASEATAASLFPNPLDGPGQLWLPADGHATAVNWCDALGRIVRSDAVAPHAHGYMVDPTGLAPGAYLLQAYGEHGPYPPVRAIVVAAR